MKLLFHDMPAYVDDVLIANNQRVIDIVDYLIPMRHGLIECCAYGYDEHNENNSIRIIIRIILMRHENRLPS